MEARPHLCITLGDPCGISAEVLLKSLPSLCSRATLTVVGARAGLDLLVGRLPSLPAWAWERLASSDEPGCEAWRLDTGTCSVTWLDPTPDTQLSRLTLGQGSAASGRCAVEGVRLGARLVMQDRADALVTLPLAKSAVHQAGVAIPGHTEFLQALSGSPRTRMAFASPTLNVVLHTVHQSLRSVIDGLEAVAVAETLLVTAAMFPQPPGRDGLRIALAALNPHAGEAGAFGQEEGVLEEALALARRALASGDHPILRMPSATATPGRSITLSGPHPADSLFLQAHRGAFDVVVALYHDQGLIPVKLIEPTRAVNLTLGLPFIRTSPDHGTAFDIAGRGLADPANTLEAAALALRLAAARPRR